MTEPRTGESESEGVRFLLAEYTEVWAYLRHLDSTRNKALALYLIVLGAIAGGVTNAIRDRADAKTLKQLVDAAPVILGIVLVFSMMASTALLMLLIRYRLLAVEYTWALNRIRAAFVRREPALRQFLVFSDQSRRARGWSGAMYIYTFAAVVSAVVVWFGALGVLRHFNAFGTHTAVEAFGLAAVWCVYWIATYHRLCRRFDDNMDRRLKRLDSPAPAKGAA